MVYSFYDGIFFKGFFNAVSATNLIHLHLLWKQKSQRNLEKLK